MNEPAYKHEIQIIDQTMAKTIDWTNPIEDQLGDCVCLLSLGMYEEICGM